MPLVDAQMILEEKQSQRKAGTAARKALSLRARAEADSAVCLRLMNLDIFQRARTVLLYAAFGGEASLEKLADQTRGKRLAYPVCLPEWKMLAALPLGPESWEIGKYGIRTPVLERSRVISPEKLDLVLVPCTAFDADCRRVGMGKGYYDRYLPQCVNAVKIGVAFECQRVERAATGQYDQRLDGFVTERTFYTWKK